MAIQVKFLDNVSYKAEDLNSIPVIFGGQTMSKFLSGQTYGTEDINAITQTLTSKGVLWSGGNLAVNIVNGNARISTGTAIFNSGAEITLTTFEDLILTPNIINYVYVEHNVSQNYIRPMISTIYPTGDIVMLAEISPTRIITDKREFSRAKNGTMGANISKTINIPAHPMGLAHNTVVFTSDFDLSPYNYLMAKYYNDRAYSIAIFDIINGTNYAYNSIMPGGTYWAFDMTNIPYSRLYSEFNDADSGNLFFEILKQNNKIIVTFKASKQFGSETTVAFSLNFT